MITVARHTPTIRVPILRCSSLVNCFVENMVMYCVCDLRIIWTSMLHEPSEESFSRDEIMITVARHTPTIRVPILRCSSLVNCFVENMVMYCVCDLRIIWTSMLHEPSEESFSRDEIMITVARHTPTIRVPILRCSSLVNCFVENMVMYCVCDLRIIWTSMLHEPSEESFSRDEIMITVARHTPTIRVPILRCSSLVNCFVENMVMYCVCDLRIIWTSMLHEPSEESFSRDEIMITVARHTPTIRVPILRCSSLVNCFVENMVMYCVCDLRIIWTSMLHEPVWRVL